MMRYSGCSLVLQTLHFLFVIYEHKKGAVEDFIHFGMILASVYWQVSSLQKPIEQK